MALVIVIAVIVVIVNLGILKTNKKNKTKLGLFFVCCLPVFTVQYVSILYSVTVNFDIALNKHMNQ